MKISEKQIMELMSLIRRYANFCSSMNMKMDDHEKCKELHRAIESQQSDELKVIE